MDPRDWPIEDNALDEMNSDESDHDHYEDDPETWQDYFSEELVTMYHMLVDYCKARGVPVLDACTMNDFASFAYTFSSGRKPDV